MGMSPIYDPETGTVSDGVDGGQKFAIAIGALVFCGLIFCTVMFLGSVLL